MLTNPLKSKTSGAAAIARPLNTTIATFRIAQRYAPDLFPEMRLDLVEFPKTAERLSVPRQGKAWPDRKVRAYVQRETGAVGTE